MVIRPRRRRSARDLEAAQRGVNRVRSWPATSTYPFIVLLTACEEACLKAALALDLVRWERAAHVPDFDTHEAWHLAQFLDRLSNHVQWNVARWVQIYALLAGDPRALPPLASVTP